MYDEPIETTAELVPAREVTQLDYIQGMCEQILGMLMEFATFKSEAEAALAEFKDKGIMGLMAGGDGFFKGLFG